MDIIDNHLIAARLDAGDMDSEELKTISRRLKGRGLLGKDICSILGMDNAELSRMRHGRKRIKRTFAVAIRALERAAG